jgi:hypothetical protein
VLVAVVVGAISDVEVTSGPPASVAAPTEEEVAGVELVGIGETKTVCVVSEAAEVKVSLAAIDIPPELANDGKLRTCPACRSVGTTPGLAPSSCCVLTPSAAAIASSVSPDTTVYVPVAALVVEFDCLGLRWVEANLQTGFASAGNGPEIKEAPTARRWVPGMMRAEANDVLAKRPRRSVDFMV